MIPSFSFRDLSARLGLKDGWKEALSALAVGGVPTFVFSSGHGDVISQVILHTHFKSWIDIINPFEEDVNLNLNLKLNYDLLQASIHSSDLHHFNRCYADIAKAELIVFSIPYNFPIRRLFTNRICSCFPPSMFEDLYHTFTFFLFLTLQFSRTISLRPTHSSIFFSRILFS